MQLEFSFLSKNSNEFQESVIIKLDKQDPGDENQHQQTTNVVDLDYFRKAKAFAKMVERAAKVVDW